MPSATDLIFIGILTAVLFTSLAVRLLGDAGIGWHIRTGQEILATHAIPHTDLFSSTMAGKPWFAWEWLYDVVVGELESRLGLSGVVWFTAVIIAATFAWMFRLLITHGLNLATALLLTLLALSASTIHFLARPHVLTWLFTLVCFWILCSSENDSVASKRLWWLPVLMLVWVNVHGGFLIGFVLAGIFLCSAVWEWYRVNENRIEDSLAKIAGRRRAWILGKVIIVSAAASLLNPYGWNLHAHIYSYLSSRFLMNHVEEFQSPNFHGLAEKCFGILLLATVAALAARGRQLRASAILTILFAVYAGLYASRNIPMSSILLGMTVGPLLVSKDHQGQRPSLLQRLTRTELQMHGHAWCLVAALATLLCCVQSRRAAHPIVDAHFDPNRMPVDAVNYLEQNQLRGPVFSPDSWGGYLIYRLYPRERVVLDDRHDLYGEALLKSYLKALHGESGWQEFLQKHEAECLVLPKNAALTNLLMQSHQWKQVFADGVATVFVSRDEAGKH